MNKESINCINYPIDSDSLVESEFPLVQDIEGPMAKLDMHFADDRNVFIRSFKLEGSNVLDPRRFPSGGHAIRKWMKKEEDGAEVLSHYHVEFFPELATDAREFIDSKLDFYRGRDRTSAANALADELPKIYVCPGNAIAISNKESHFIMLEDGKRVAVDKTRPVSLWPDDENGVSYLRFGLYTSDIVDSATEQEYRIFATGAMVAGGPEYMKEKLDALMENGQINQERLSRLARLVVSISPKEI